MKCIILFSCLIAVAYGISAEDKQKMKTKFMKMGQECQTQTGANGDDVNQIMKKQAPARKEGKCLIMCVHKKIGFQDAAGKKDPAGISAWIEEITKMDADFGGKAKIIADKCAPSIDDSGDECDTAGLMFDCYMTEAKAAGVQLMFR